MEVHSMLRKLIVALLALGGAGYAGYQLVLKPWWRRWGVMPDEAIAPLPGDEVVPDAMTSETRGITIDAPPAAVWPWLVQMGYGRGGWYSIDQLDMRGKSAERIVEAWQGLAVGDVVPMHPGGGFEVKVLEPNRALVLFGDPSTMQPMTHPEGEELPAGLAASGSFLAATPSEFRASWSFVLEPLGPSRTRLIERMRYWSAEGTPVTKAALSLLGFGAFVMMQRQMTAIRERAERLAIEDALPPILGSEPVAANGHEPEVPHTVLAAADAG
jgi:hypothetical protein